MADSKASHGRRRVAVIYNPTAGWRRKRRLRRVLDHLERLGCEVLLLRTRAPRHATELAREVSGVDAVVVAGGDGTINEVVNGLNGDAPPLGIIPLGTANVLAMELGIARRASRIAETIVDGVEQPIALGVANGRRFVQMVGIGADAYVVEHVSKPVKRILGKGAYVWSSLQGLFSYPFPSFALEIDGVAVSASSVIVSNGRFYGGRNVVAPAASLERDTFEVCVMTRYGRFNALRYGLAVFLDLLPRLGDVRQVTAKHIKVLGPIGQPVQGDGDIVAALPADVTVLPGALRVLIPKPA